MPTFSGSPEQALHRALALGAVDRPSARGVSCRADMPLLGGLARLRQLGKPAGQARALFLQRHELLVELLEADQQLEVVEHGSLRRGSHSIPGRPGCLSRRRAALGPGTPAARGMRPESPPRWLRFRCPVAEMTQPATRKRSALNNAWFTTW